MTAGLAAYLLGTPKHYSVITAAVTEILSQANPPTPGVAFVQSVRDYMVSLAYARCGSGAEFGAPGAGGLGPPTIYNGEVPLNNQGAPVLQKRQAETVPSCPGPAPAGTFCLITPNYDADISVLNDFTNTLQAETNATTLGIGSTGSGFIAYWTQNLTQSQVNTYLSSPAVSVSPFGVLPIVSDMNLS
jgi:hypothetical protein